MDMRIIPPKSPDHKTYTTVNGEDVTFACSRPQNVIKVAATYLSARDLSFQTLTKKDCEEL